MESSRETNKIIEERQILEQHLSEFLAQKQVIQVELQEISNALEDLEKTEDDVYKILSGIMIKADKNVLLMELGEKRRVLQLKISAIEKQEKIIEDKINKTRKKIEELLNKDNKKVKIIE